MQRQGELCVCEMTHALGMVQPKVSRHLALLREAGVVQDRRDGLWIFYRVHPDLPGWARQVIAEVAAGVGSYEPYAGDAGRLKSMTDRPRVSSCGC